jgi:predicted nucleic acid-binding protein
VLLVDTSSWIHLLRPDGDPTVHARVEEALAAGTACWCPVIQLELWNGARGDRERRALRGLAEALPELPIDEEVWRTAYELAQRARRRGVTVPATDVLIAACAARHVASLETADSDFELLSSLDAPTS